MVHKYRLTLAGVILIGLTLAAYWQITGHDFAIIDDEVYVYANQHVKTGITPGNLAWAFSFADKEDTYWHPLTWISHMVDCSLFGLRPGWHHFSSLLLHLANSLLLFIVLRQMTGADGRSLLVAALFALHPLNVESVAWIAERKNLLSTFFWMLTLLAYIRYCRLPGPGTYLTTMSIFGLGLLAKPMLVTLPCVLLLLDYWPLRRIRPDRIVWTGSGRPAAVNLTEHRRTAPWLVMEKVPLMALSGLSVFLSMQSLQKLGTVVPTSAVPVDLRIANALVSYLTYIWKMIWPAGLAVIYPYPETMPPHWQTGGALFLIAVLSLFFIRTAKSRPYLIVGWLWYLGTLLPVSGLVQGGLWPAMADRWTYVPLIGLFVMIAWGCTDLLSPWKIKPRWFIILSASGMAALAILTWKQAGYWRDSTLLFEHTLAVTGPNCAAHDILGIAFEKQGQKANAITHYRKALQINPDFEDAHYNLGTALFQQGKTEAAIGAYVKALKINPNSEKTHFNLGVAYEKQGDFERAIAYYQRALKYNPGFAKAYYNQGVLFEKQGKLVEAIAQYIATIEIDPAFEKAHINLGTSFGRSGQSGKAATHFRKALTLNPENASTHFNLGIALAGQGRNKAAIEHYVKALQIEPGFVAAHNNIAILYFESGNFTRAKEHLQEVTKRDPGNAMANKNLEMIRMHPDQDAGL